MKTKLKIGDKVRVINKDDNFYGRIGKIVRIERFTQFPLRVLFEDNVGVFTTSELQLIKPVRKWKYTRKELVAKYSYDNNYYTSNMCKDLLAKSEHTEDKSDMLSTKSSVEKSCSNCKYGDTEYCIKPVCDKNLSGWISKNPDTQPTLKPIKMSYAIDDKKWKEQITNRINLLSEKI